VTTGYSGLGRETVRVLRGAGARVIVPTRDIERAKKALREIPGVNIEPMDLLDPATIDAFTDPFLAFGKPLHLLSNSAGIKVNPAR
jgi:NAD(P)-dependent dehydrogenase (short-subunit alcohol dehydrogenase family)